MTPLFPAWSDTVFRLALVTVAATAIVVPVAFIVWARTPYATGQYDTVEQPVQFDHRHHVRDDGVDCLYCHHDATKSAFAGLPSTELCMNCHSQVWNDSALLLPVRESYFQKRPIVWTRVHDMPDFVYFDHSAHTNRGVGCAECHGRVDQMAMVYAEAPLTMGWCLDCHRDPAPHLRPETRITDMTYRQESPEVGRAIMAARHIHPPTNCSGCHR